MAKKRTKSYVHNEFDTPWKDVLRSLFPEFMHFFFAEAADRIDWKAGYNFMDKELKRITRDAETANRIADSLVKARLLSGETVFIMLHVEIQGSPEAKFAERMYTYNYRIFDRYRLPTASFALLTDESVSWRPQEFTSSFLGTRTQFEFRAAKLLDFRSTVETIVNAPPGVPINPFAVMTLAHLQAQATRRAAAEEVTEHSQVEQSQIKQSQTEQSQIAQSQLERYRQKLRMVRMLYENHFSKEQIIEIFRFLDWVLALPPSLEQQLDTVISEELEGDMPYLARFERKAMERGFERGIEQGIEQGEAQGIGKGERKKALEAARKLLPILDDRQISDIVGLPLEEIEQIRRETAKNS